MSHSVKNYLNTTKWNKILREAQAGNLEDIKQFRMSYPDLHWSDLRYEKTGDTILHTLARLGHNEAVKYLLQNYQPNGVDCRNIDNKTALHDAAQFAKYETVNLLLEMGAEVNALKKADWTPLMLACTKIQGANSYKTVKILLEKGAALNYQNKDGWTALHLISREGDLAILKLLVAFGLDVNRITKNGRTALHVAALHGSYDIVYYYLIDLGLDVNKIDSCGNTVLHEALLGGNLQICELLVKNGHCDVNVRNKSEYNALHLVASRGNIDVIKYVIERLKIDVNTSTNSGLTPLHCAGRNHQKGAYDFLIECGADEFLKDKFGRTPADYKNE